jgi:hypothetical protein
MTKQVDYDIVGGYNNQRVTNIDAERTINLFVYIDPLGKKKKNLLSTSGISSEINNNLPVVFPSAAPTDGFRQQFVFNGFTYQVIGPNVYKYDAAYAVTQINTSPLTTTVGYVAIDANTFQLIFTDGQHGYIYDTSSLHWAQITDPAFPAQPLDACFLDGFFIVINGGTNQFQLSSLNQGLIWGPDFLTGTGNTFTATIATSNIVLTSGSTVNYQVGTPVVFTGLGLPGGLTAGTTYYVSSIVSPSPPTITVSATNGGTAIVFSSSSTGTPTLTNAGQLQLGEVTTHPGTLVACKTLHRRLFLFSQNFTEVWENAGMGTTLPFRRNNTLLMEYGCAATASVRVGFDRMFFLSQDKDGLGSVMMVAGTESIPVSPRSLINQFATYAATPGVGVADGVGVLLQENGLIFYRLNFTAANDTYVYNVTMSNPQQGELYWHEEQTLAGGRHVAQVHAFFNGINYYGAYNSPTLYIVNSSYVTNDGTAIQRIRITRAFAPEGYQRIRIDRMHVDLVQGMVDMIGEDTTENNSPIVYMSISKDGGVSYGNRLLANMGMVGERTFRTVWRKLGTIPRGQAFVAKFEFYNQVPFTILGAAWAIEVMPE